MAAQVLNEPKSRSDGYALCDKILGHAEQRGAGNLEQSFAERDEQVELDRLVDELRAFLAVDLKALAQLVGRDHLRRLGIRHRVGRLLDAQKPLARIRRVLEQPSDALELHALGLELLDQPQPRDV